jgi:TAG lipase/steryl ester hydrolase/phospholipase A2/LPA acyltransferase
MNYLTTPSVLVWSAVLASIAAPGLFDKVELMRKNDRGETKPYFPSFTRQRYVDGSIANDLPMKRISELFNVNTFIVSQVNPHVVPFISVDFGAILDTGLWK